MAKQKKTRQEKIIADLRRQLALTERKPSFSIPPSTSLKPQQKYIVPIVPIKTISLTNSYLLPDLTKTTLVTSAILAGELVLFFLLKKQILILPMVKF